MRISWVLSNTSVVGEEGGFTSPLASYRYRALNPVRELRTRGHVCQLHVLSDGGGTSNHAALHESDVIVFAKNHSEPYDVIALLDYAREREIATIVDICDDYLAPGDKFQPYYMALVNKAKLVTASSPRLASIARQVTDANVCVVADAYEAPMGSIRFAPEGASLKVLWFGTPFNLASLISELEDLPRRIESYQVNLVVLTREPQGLVKAFEMMNAQNGDKFRLTFKEWSLEQNWMELEKCDLVAITVDTQKTVFYGKRRESTDRNAARRPPSGGAAAPCI